MRTIQIINNLKISFNNRNNAGALINDNEIVISKRGTENRQYVKDLYYIYSTLELQII
jgi:hypothetical protein